MKELEVFVALLALDPEKRGNYLADPETALKAADLRLPEEVRELLRKICEVLSNPDFPLPAHVIDP